MSTADIASQAMTLRRSMLSMKSEIEQLKHDAHGRCDEGISCAEDIQALYNVKTTLRKQRDVAFKTENAIALLTAENRLVDVRRQIDAKKSRCMSLMNRLQADKETLNEKSKQYDEAKKQYNALFQ
jgi:hypothetical protein